VRGQAAFDARHDGRNLITTGTGKSKWGAKGWNPEPTDYEKHAQSQHVLDQQRCLTWHAMNAHMALGSPGASVHAAVHAKEPCLGL
jgi:hypothetical protein